MYRRGLKVARPLVRALTDAPMPPDKVFGSVLVLFHRIEQLHRTLVDPELTSIRPVLNPEKMVVAEAQRTYTYLSPFGYPTDLVVANRIVPSDVVDPYFAAWKDAQAAQLQRIREGFAPLPVKTVPLFGNEVLGLDHCVAWPPPHSAQMTPPIGSRRVVHPPSSSRLRIAIGLPCRFRSLRAATSVSAIVATSC